MMCKQCMKYMTKIRSIDFFWLSSFRWFTLWILAFQHEQMSLAFVWLKKCHFQCQDNCRHKHTYEAANAYLPTASSRLLNWNNFALLFLEFVPWPCKEKPVVEGYVTFVSNFEPVNLQIHHSNKFSLDWSLISF